MYILGIHIFSIFNLCFHSNFICASNPTSGSRHSEAGSGELQQELVELRGKHQKLIIEYISLQNSLRNKKGSGDGYHGNAPPTPTLTDALQSEVARLMEENLTLREMMEKGGSPSRSPQVRNMMGNNSECLCACV